MLAVFRNPDPGIPNQHLDIVVIFPVEIADRFERIRLQMLGKIIDLNLANEDLHLALVGKLQRIRE